MTGSNANHTVLAPNADLTFSVVETNLPRPFPLGSYAPGLRNAAAAIHLADMSGDGMADLIACSNQETGSLATWSLHIWQPGGFAANGEIIPVLDGIPCNVQTYVVDTNGDSWSDLVFPGYSSQGGVPTETSGNFSGARRNTNGEWETLDTGLPVGKTLFVDTNADGLPDAIFDTVAAHSVTRMNPSKGIGICST